MLEKAENQNRQAALDAYHEAVAGFETAREKVYAIWRDPAIPAAYQEASAARERLHSARTALASFPGVPAPPPLPARRMYVLAKDDNLRRAKKRWDDARRMDF